MIRWLVWGQSQRITFRHTSIMSGEQAREQSAGAGALYFSRAAD
jgi:hypothetical protein